ncbi:MAG: S1 RNA-binding domain-containing protein, partial [Longicatena sp.]
EECNGVKIDIEDDGSVVIYHVDRASITKAADMIRNLVKVAKVGDIYEAKIVRLEKFGAFVNLFPGTDGLLHISKINNDRVEKVEDVLTLGDMIKVKVTEVDDRGRVNVSAKALLPKPEKKVDVPTEGISKDNKPAE